MKPLSTVLPKTVAVLWQNYLVRRGFISVSPASRSSVSEEERNDRIRSRSMGFRSVEDSNPAASVFP